jgi:hypothetical protein
MMALPRLPAVAPLAFALACPAVFGAGHTATGTAALQADAAIDLKVVIPQLLSMRLIDHPAEVTVTASEAAAGEVVVSGPRLALLANDRRGYFLEARLAEPFSAASIEGLPAPLSVTSDGGRALMPSMVGMQRPEPYRVRYHLRLREGTVAGTYAWPVALQIESP